MMRMNVRRMIGGDEKFLRHRSATSEATSMGHATKKKFQIPNSRFLLRRESSVRHSAEDDATTTSDHTMPLAMCWRQIPGRSALAKDLLPLSLDI